MHHKLWGPFIFVLNEDFLTNTVTGILIKYQVSHKLSHYINMQIYLTDTPTQEHIVLCTRFNAVEC